MNNVDSAKETKSTVLTTKLGLYTLKIRLLEPNDNDIFNEITSKLESLNDKYSSNTGKTNEMPK